MAQKRLDRSTIADSVQVGNIDAMFDDLFDVVALSSATNTLVSQTAAQPLLNTSPLGALTLPVGTYEFEAFFALSSMSASSGGFGFDLKGAGSATLTQAWKAEAFIAAGEATPVAEQTSYNVAANTELVTAAGSDGDGFASIRGILRVTVQGTIIPSVSLTVAAAAVVAANAMFRIKKLSPSATVQAIAPPQPNPSKLAWS